MPLQDQNVIFHSDRLAVYSLPPDMSSPKTYDEVFNKALAIVPPSKKVFS